MVAPSRLLTGLLTHRAAQTRALVRRVARVNTRNRLTRNRTRLILGLAALAALVVLPAGLAIADPGDGAANSWVSPFQTKDSQGIPMSSYRLSIDEGGVTNPKNMFAATFLQFAWELYQIYVGTALWLFDYALQFQMLQTLRGPAAAIAGALQETIGQIGVIPALTVVAFGICAVWIQTGKAASGLAGLFIALLMGSLLTTAAVRPMEVIAGDSGLIMGSRDLGVGLSSQIVSGGESDSTDATELQSRSSAKLVDVFIRTPHQLINYGASDLVDKGGQWWAIDKSEDGEWAVFARTFESHQVVDAMDPQVTMDPLMTLPAEQAGDVLRTFLVQLLNIDTTGGLGVVLGQVTEATYLQGHQITSSAQLCAHLADGGCDLPDEEDRRLARQLGQAMRNWTKTGVARVIFDDSLPPVDLTVSATAWRTHGMEQPTDREMSNEHLFKQLPPEKVFGRAYYRMLCRLARRLCFADRSRAAAFVTDEMYDITQNSENVGDIQHFLRRGRRPKALLLAGTHDVGDLHDEVLAGLIPTRVLVRHRDAGLAANGLRWLGIKEDDPAWADMLKKVTEDLSPVQGDQGVPLERRGEAFLRDAFGGIGLVKILPPARPSRRAAVFTTPPKSRSAA